MREAVQLGAVAVEVVGVADIVVDSVRAARACGTNRAMETQKGAIFKVATVSEGMNESETGRKNQFEQKCSLLGSVLLFIHYLYLPRRKRVTHPELGGFSVLCGPLLLAEAPLTESVNKATKSEH